MIYANCTDHASLSNNLFHHIASWQANKGKPIDQTYFSCGIEYSMKYAPLIKLCWWWVIPYLLAGGYRTERKTAHAEKRVALSFIVRNFLVDLPCTCFYTCLTSGTADFEVAPRKWSLSPHYWKQSKKIHHPPSRHLQYKEISFNSFWSNIMNSTTNADETHIL